MEPTPEQQKARKIVDGCIQELRFGGEHTDMSQVEPVRQIALDQLRDRIAAALVEAGRPDLTTPLPQGEYECDGVNCPPRAHDHKVLDAQGDLISREATAQWVDGQKLFWMERQKNAKGNDEHFYNGKVVGADFIAAKIRALPAAPAGQQADLISREAAIRVVQQSFRPAHTYASENADRYRAQDEGQRMAINTAVDRVIALPAAHPTGECVWTRRQRGDHFWYTTECATVHDAMRFGEFCPYCGKQLVEHPTREK